MGKLRRSDFDLVDNIKYSRRDLVLIDESHHFKTGKSTRQYENLNNFMKRQAAKAILLTATPYANKPSDIKNQIMLFHANENETEIPVSDGNLGKFFDEVKHEKKSLSEILRHIMIRRTRRYLIKHWGKKDERGNDYLIGKIDFLTFFTN
jgi:SNF2 family DNA or RNA helicase